MLPHGSDRVREVAGKVILHSRISKGWTARTPKTLTNAEHPGTTVLWGEQHFEVVTADVLPAGGIRYVLEPWRDEHVIRTFEAYDDASEARLAADFTRAQRQRRHGVLTRLAGIFLGQLPAPVQNHLANELGVSAPRMTMVSCLPALVLLGACAYAEAGARIEQRTSPIPLLLWFVAAFLMLESAVRFFVVMSQNRPMGTLLGTTGYALFHALAGSRRRESLPKPFEEPGDGVFFAIPPTAEIALRDSLLMRAPMITLLPAGEQARLARIFGFNYREHAFGPTWFILFFSVIGAATSFTKIQHGRGSTAVISMIVALALAAEQILRLIQLRRGPKGSVLGILVRPFLRDLLARR
jgi:hypothetical protein